MYLNWACVCVCFIFSLHLHVYYVLVPHEIYIHFVVLFSERRRYTHTSLLFYFIFFIVCVCVCFVFSSVYIVSWWYVLFGDGAGISCPIFPCVYFIQFTNSARTAYFFNYIHNAIAASMQILNKYNAIFEISPPPPKKKAMYTFAQSFWLFRLMKTNRKMYYIWKMSMELNYLLYTKSVIMSLCFLMHHLLKLA